MKRKQGKGIRTSQTRKTNRKSSTTMILRDTNIDTYTKVLLLHDMNITTVFNTQQVASTIDTQCDGWPWCLQIQCSTASYYTRIPGTSTSLPRPKESESTASISITCRTYIIYTKHPQLPYDTAKAELLVHESTLSQLIAPPAIVAPVLARRSAHKHETAALP